MKNFMKNRGKLSAVVETFDPFLERWEQQPTTGVPPVALWGGACTSLISMDSLYAFGGWDGISHYDSLHQLRASTMEWRELEESISQDAPMRKTGCEMVPFNDDTLVLFGGLGIPRDIVQPGSRFMKAEGFSDGRGWTNELHLFDVKEGKLMAWLINNL